MSTPTQPIKPAATVIIVRDATSGYEIFMLKRTSKASFAGGMFVFPGGRVDGDDHLHAYDVHRTGPSEVQTGQVKALGDEWRGFWVAAIRETFEEAGLLLAYDAQGRLVSYDDDETFERLQGYRNPLHAGEIDMLEICRRENLKLAVDHVHFYNRFVTPLGRPRRFDTRFFVAETPPTQVGAHDEKETVDSMWISPQEALARNKAGEFDLMNVTRIQLESLAGYNGYDEVVAMAASKDEFPIRRPIVPTGPGAVTK